MANVKICDRCGKRLTEKRSIIGLKALHYRLGIEVLKEMSYFPGEFRREEKIENDLCKNYTKLLAEFLDGKAVEAVINE